MWNTWPRMDMDHNMIWIDVEDVYTHMQNWTHLRKYLDWRFGSWNETWRYSGLTVKYNLKC